MKGVCGVDVDFKNKTATVTMESGKKLDSSAAKTALTKKGLGLNKVTSELDSKKTDKLQKKG